jgi:hypothetical protein
MSIGDAALQMKMFDNVCRVKFKIEYVIEDVIGKLFETILDPICLSLSTSSYFEKIEVEINS